MPHTAFSGYAADEKQCGMAPHTGLYAILSYRQGSFGARAARTLKAQKC